MRSILLVIATFVLVICVLVYVPGAYAWSNSLTPYFEKIFGYLAVIYAAPCLLLLYLFGLVFGTPDWLSYPTGAWQLDLFGLFALIVSPILWSTGFSRISYFNGLWNPFKLRSGTPWFLRFLVKIRDWWEILVHFGKKPTGGWAGLLEVLSLRHEPGQIFLGRPRLKFFGGLLRPIGIETEKHMVTIAGPGAGKSTGALIPNLCIHPGSLLCIDPKGELARITAGRRGGGGGSVYGMGQDVHVLDPFGITGIKTCSYNVLDEMARMAERDVNAPIAYATKVAEALVEIKSRDPYWDNAARGILKGLILYVFQGPSGKRNLSQVRRLLMLGDKEAFERGVQSGDIDPERNDPFDALLVDMQNCPEGPYKEAIAYTASTILRMPENQRGSVLSIAQEHTSFLDIPELKGISQTSDFLLNDLKERPMSVYLSLPLNLVEGVAGGWLRMFVLLLVDMMFRSSKVTKNPILLAIDEFPSLGKLDGIVLVGPTLRSQGVRLWVVGQDIAQFRTTYPETWGSFLGNAEAVQFMGIKHPETVKMVVEFLDRHEVEGWEGEGKFRRRVSTERNLLDANQVSKLLLHTRKNQIVWRGDRRPILLKITPYFKYLPYWYYDPDPRFPEAWNRRLWRAGRKGTQGIVRRGQPVLPTQPVIPPALQGTVDSSNRGEFMADPPKPPYVVDYKKYLPPDPEKPKLLDLKNYLPPEPKKPEPPPAESWATKLLSLDPPKPPSLGPSTTIDELRRDAIRLGKLPPGELLPNSGIIPKLSTPPFSLYLPTAPISLYQPPPANPGLPRFPQKPSALPPEVLRIVDPGSVDTQDPIDELDNMIGLKSVKEEVKKTLSIIKLRQARKTGGLPPLDLTHHLVFVGNPGTGKTTVARIIGRLYRDYGLLKSGHLVEADRSSLIAGFSGQTAIKTRKVIERAVDGVLFIDEAYSLVSQSQGDDDNFGAEAIATLLKMMEDKRDRLVVIVAGYRAEMADFIASNPGLESRFKKTIDFPDYSPKEMMEILVGISFAAGNQFSPDALTKVAHLLAAADKKMQSGNGRFVRNLFGEIIALQAMRLHASNKYGTVDLRMIEAADIPDAGDM